MVRKIDKFGCGSKRTVSIGAGANDDDDDDENDDQVNPIIF